MVYIITARVVVVTYEPGIGYKVTDCDKTYFL